MMTMLWTAPAKVLVDRAESGWEGIWTLTYAAGLAAINLGSVVPLGVAIDLSLAALDFAHAQSALERVRPDLPGRCAAVDLGDVDPDEGEPRARLIIDQMASAALGRIATLTATDLPVPELAALSQAGSLLFTGRAWVTGRRP